VQAVLATRGEPVRRVVFDLSNVTFMDVAALTAILRADEQGRGEGFEVVVVRPPALGARLFTLSRAIEHLRIVDHPREAGADDRQGAIVFRRLSPEELFTCVRCRSNPAVLEGQGVGGLTLVSADGPICAGCVTREEQIEMGEAILRELRWGEPPDEAKIRELEEALAELRTEPAD
jgi:anti-anti-sigma regulatory factor